MLCCCDVVNLLLSLQRRSRYSQAQNGTRNDGVTRWPCGRCARMVLVAACCSLLLLVAGSCVTTKCPNCGCSTRPARIPCEACSLVADCSPPVGLLRQTFQHHGARPIVENSRECLFESPSGKTTPELAPLSHPESLKCLLHPEISIF
jgi:hypothetical protein